jgi:nicotinamide-nucleotide amidase
MNAEILAIGDEITSGQLLDTNSQWLSLRLEEMGVRVLYHSTVGDELEPSAEAFRLAIGRADLVVATGGLGPTADDLTRDALALATGRKLQLHAEALDSIHRIFARLKYPMSKQNELQAMFPEGSRVVHNPHGTAPGIDMICFSQHSPKTNTATISGADILVCPVCGVSLGRQECLPHCGENNGLEFPQDHRHSCRVICLPGVPAEMVEMWHDSVAASILAMCEGRRRFIRRRTIKCFGAGESMVESMLPDLIRRGRRPTVGITAGKATISLRIAADGETEEECVAAIEPVAATIRQCLGKLVFGEGDDELQDVVVRLLREQGKTLATAESATAGLLTDWLGSVEKAKDVYRGGLVLMETADSAEDLAIRCREQFQADYGLAIGPLLPSPASGRGAGGEGVEMQTVVVALSSSSGVTQKEVPFSYHPELRRIFVAKHALNFLRLALLA